MIFKRSIDQHVVTYLSSNSYKTFFVWGPRRSGKTTLLKRLSQELGVPVFNFDYQSDRLLFEPERNALGKLAGSHKVILIDEVQNAPESTIALKLLHDEFKVKVIATGSSELRQTSGKDFDSLAGRYHEAYCLPLSVKEIQENTPIALYHQDLFFADLAKQIQIFGTYPELYVAEALSDEQKIELLDSILNTYVLKDVIDIYNLKNAKLARDILTKIALQLGSEVSVREIAQSLGANKDTVSNYIEIFVKNYILISLPSFGTNVRRAVSENKKLYFYDLGIRNSLVRDFRDPALRPDRGGVFENFILSEIEKERKNTGVLRSLYFYREYGGKEIDLVIEDYKKNYRCVEIKEHERGGNRDIFPLPHTFETITLRNYFDAVPTVLAY